MAILMLDHRTLSSVEPLLTALRERQSTGLDLAGLSTKMRIARRRPD
jgi:hypothetical protein